MVDFVTLLFWLGRIAFCAVMFVFVMRPTAREVVAMNWIIAGIGNPVLVQMSRYQGPNGTFLRTLKQKYLLGTAVKQSVELPEFLKPYGYLVQSDAGEILGIGKIDEQFIQLRRPLMPGEQYSIIATMPVGR